MKRLGVLIPPANTTCEVEFPSVVDQSVCTFHFSRLERVDRTLNPESLINMKKSASRAASLFLPISPDAIAYACTSGSFLSGSSKHDEISKIIEKDICVPVITTSTAVIESMEALKAKRISVITPYPTNIAEETLNFLKAFGFLINNFYTFNYIKSDDVRAISQKQISDKVREMVASDEALDAIFISCTNVSTLGYLASLEEEVGVPLVSSNSATLKSLLKKVNLTGVFKKLGKLGEV